MRVALLTSGTGPHGDVARTLALAAALARAGAQVTVWSPAPGSAGASPADPAVRLRRVPSVDVPGEDTDARARRLTAELGRAFAAAGEEYHVVHARDRAAADAVPGCVRTVHPLDVCSAGGVRVGPLLCGSGAVAAAVRSRWGREATVVRDGVDGERFAAAAGPRGAAGRGRWRARLGRYVLAVGGVGPRSGVLDLIEAMATVQLLRPDVTLVVTHDATPVGTGGYRAVVDAWAQDLEVYPLVLGPVPGDELPELVAAADALAVPSAEEGSAPAAMEALAAGVPVVARDLPVLRELLGGAATLAARPAGFAAGLLAATDPDPGRTAAGRALAARHTWEVAALAHLRCYEALIAGGMRQPVRT